MLFGSILLYVRWRRVFRVFLIVGLIVLLIFLLTKIPHRESHSEWTRPLASEISYHQHNITFAIENPNLCVNLQQEVLKDKVKNDPLLFVFVESAPQNFERRRQWRNNWGRMKTYNNHRVIIAFLLALPKNDSISDQIQQEYVLHQDIIQLNYVDSYENLTMKTIGGFHWTIRHCNTARFVMKTDDDVIIFMHKLVPELLEMNFFKESRLYTGYSSRYHEVQRSAGDRWQVSKEEYPFRRYPPYILGMGILISNNVLQKIYNASLHIPRFKFEDIYTGMCARYAGIIRRNHKGFAHFFGPEFEDFICEYRRMKNGVLVHGLEYNRTEFYRAILSGATCQSSTNSWFSRADIL